MLPLETHCIALSRTFENWKRKGLDYPFPLQNSEQLITKHTGSFGWRPS